VETRNLAGKGFSVGGDQRRRNRRLKKKGGGNWEDCVALPNRGQRGEAARRRTPGMVLGIKGALTTILAVGGQKKK